MDRVKSHERGDYFSDLWLGVLVFSPQRADHSANQCGAEELAWPRPFLFPIIL